MNLFVYGTLIDLDIMTAVSGESPIGIEARLSGFLRRKVAHEVYPAILPAEGQSVPGRLWLEISDAILERLDRYEGEQYERWDVIVETTTGGCVAAQTYVLVAEHRHELSKEAWDFTEFLEHHKNGYLEELL